MFSKVNSLLQLAFLFSLLLTVSCTSLSHRNKNILPYLNNQKFDKAIQNIKEKKEKIYTKHNRLLYHLDLGTLYHYAQKPDTSNIYLEKALDIYNDLSTKSITTQSLSTLLNSEISPYRSYNYEIIAVHQMISLNYQTLKQPYESLVETRRAQLKFDYWKKSTIKKYHYDGSFNFLSFLYYFMLEEKDNGLISLYQSVLGFNQNLANLPNIVEQEAGYLFPKYNRKNDLSKLKISKNSPEYKSITRLIHKDSAQIIIIGYAGKGPIFEDEIWSGTYSPVGILNFHHYNPKTKKKESFSLPAVQLLSFQNAYSTYHIKLALPQSVPQISKTQHFKIATENKPNDFKITETLTNYDLLSQQYITENKTKMFIKSITRVAFKTGAILALKKKIAQGNPLDIFSNLLIDASTDALESSDTRNLSSLPRTIEISHLRILKGKQKILIQPINKKGFTLGKPKEYIVDLKSGETQFLFTSSFE